MASERLGKASLKAHKTENIPDLQYRNPIRLGSRFAFHYTIHRVKQI
jgi:hypothetical protein